MHNIRYVLYNYDTLPVKWCDVLEMCRGSTCMLVCLVHDMKAAVSTVE